MPPPKIVNPFYVLLVVAGVVFCLTACAYGVMMVRELEPSRRPAEPSALVTLMAERGVTLLMVELAVLAAATAAAITTDGFWARRAERRAATAAAKPQTQEPPA